MGLLAKTFLFEIIRPRFLGLMSLSLDQVEKEIRDICIKLVSHHIVIGTLKKSSDQMLRSTLYINLSRALF